MSSSHRVRSPLVLVFSLAACGGQPAAAPDAPPSLIPTSPAGVFAVTSAIDIAVPPAAAPVLATLVAATDGPDDPSRFLIDRMITTLPDGPLHTLAADAAPYLAAYLNGKLAEVAPRFAAGIDGLADGLSRISSRVATTETWQVDPSGTAIRTITGVRFQLGVSPIAVTLADNGLADISISVPVTLDATGQLALGAHAHPLPYGALLRLGLDRAVVASVVPTAHDLSGALTTLVDCDRLGSPSPYRAACRAAMIAIASEVYDRIAAIDDTPLTLELTGTAVGVDLDANGTLDELRQGRWAGTLGSASSRASIAAASFAGKSAP